MTSFSIDRTSNVALVGIIFFVFVVALAAFFNFLSCCLLSEKKWARFLRRRLCGEPTDSEMREPLDQEAADRKKAEFEEMLRTIGLA